MKMPVPALLLAWVSCAQQEPPAAKPAREPEHIEEL